MRYPNLKNYFFRAERGCLTPFYLLNFLVNTKEMAEAKQLEKSSKELLILTKESAGRAVFSSTESTLEQVRAQVLDAAE